MIDRNEIIRRAASEDVPAPTVERDYILGHVLIAISRRNVAEQIVFKGGTALRLCFFEDYRYSADLDFSLIGGLDRNEALAVISDALVDCQRELGLPGLHINDAVPPRLQYIGPLGRSRALKLDLAADELVEETTHHAVFTRYSDQAAAECLTYTLDEIAAEKLRCVIQRLQCRDIYDIHELFVVRGIDAHFIWPLFERKAKHRCLDPSKFSSRFEQRIPHYQGRWLDELEEHLAGDPPHIDAVLRAVRRELRDFLR